MIWQRTIHALCRERLLPRACVSRALAHLRVGVVAPPVGPDASLAAEVPHLELYVFVGHRLDIEADGCARGAACAGLKAQPGPWGLSIAGACAVPQLPVAQRIPSPCTRARRAWLVLALPRLHGRRPSKLDVHLPATSRGTSRPAPAAHSRAPCKPQDAPAHGAGARLTHLGWWRPPLQPATGLRAAEGHRQAQGFQADAGSAVTLCRLAKEPGLGFMP